MKVFLSHARKDDELARDLGARLERAGFSVWSAGLEVLPGDNWAKKAAKALDDSEFMVILVTPGSSESDAPRRDAEFAIGARQFENRVFSVFFGPPKKVEKDIPWVLRRLPHRYVDSAKEFSKVVKDIQQMSLAHA